MPIDEDELDRIDLKHRLYTILLGEKLFVAPIGENPQRVLDLGTGSGELACVRSQPTLLTVPSRHLGHRFRRRIPLSGGAWCGLGSDSARVVRLPSATRIRAY